MAFTFYKTTRFIFFAFWFLLIYIIAALIWWFIELNNQNHQMAAYEIQQLHIMGNHDTTYHEAVLDFEKRKTAQYIGEGSTFLLLILAGAVVIYRGVRRQLKAVRQQQEFMMAVTHELKTPIAVTKLNLETLQKRKLEDSQRERLIQNTIQESNRLNALCNNMLLSSQIEAGGYRIEKEEIGMSELVEECTQDFITRFPQRRIVPAIDPELYIDGDRLLLQMAVNNLIDNAIKYSPKEGSITVSLKPDDKKILLSVKDEGKGLDADDKKKVFDKFYRVGNKATKAAKGTGLGLYLTKKIVQQHNANISVTDNEPTGSNFTITFKAT